MSSAFSIENNAVPARCCSMKISTWRHSSPLDVGDSACQMECSILSAQHVCRVACHGFPAATCSLAGVWGSRFLNNPVQRHCFRPLRCIAIPASGSGLPFQRRFLRPGLKLVRPRLWGTADTRVQRRVAKAAACAPVHATEKSIAMERSQRQQAGLPQRALPSDGARPPRAVLQMHCLRA